MAKQTFTTGQVLTAAQMTSLQETAMGGGPATAKTASYVLVAADAGTTVAMNAAGATTITVNTGLFAAGDTVFIQNLGAGACTVTAGTATVATAGSLILPQNDAGILYFTSASAAIFYDYIQAGAVSPLTTKGDLYTFSTSDARLAVGANGTTLVADSAEATGLKWATPAGGSRYYAVFYDEKAQSTSGGTFTSGAWRTRDLNTTQINNITSCSLSSNQISLPAGTYFIIARAPAYVVYRHQTRLQNITDSTTTITGATSFSPESNIWAESFLFGQFTITGTKTFELQHQASNTKAGDGFGTATDHFVSPSIYSHIIIEKIG
jgi:hypothetical protein